MLGLCLVAVFALVAVAASSASAAEPEFGHCIAKKKSVYSDSNCQNVATKHGVPDHKGGYEWIGGEESCYPMKHGNYTESGCATVATKHGVPDHKGHFEKTGGGKFTGVGGHAVLGAYFSICGEKNEILPPVKSCSERKEAYWVYYNLEQWEGLGKTEAEFKADGTKEMNENGEEESAVIYMRPEATNEIYVPVECGAETSHGEISGPNEVKNVTARFTGCETLGFAATTEGLNEGEIETTKLKGTLGIINKTTEEVGVSLTPEVANGPFAEFDTVGGAVKITVGVGSVAYGTGPAYPGGGNDTIIAPISPINVMTSSLVEKFAEHEGKQIPSMFEGGTPGNLEAKLQGTENPEFGYNWSPAGQTMENTNTGEGPGEIKAEF